MLSDQIAFNLFNLRVISTDDEIRSEVNNFFNRLNGEVKQKTQSRWGATHEPDVSNWCSEFDVAHTFATSDRFGNQVTFLIDGSFTRADTFKFAIMWVDIFDWTKDTLTE